MAWTTLTTYSADEAVPAAQWNAMVANLSYLKAGRPQLHGDFTTTAWSLGGAAGAWEADGDAANFKLTIVLGQAGFIIVGTTVRWTSDAADNASTKFRIKCDDASTPVYSTDMDYNTEPTADDNREYTCFGYFASLAAATYTVTLEGARRVITHTVGVSNRQLVAISGYPA